MVGCLAAAVATALRRWRGQNVAHRAPGAGRFSVPNWRSSTMRSAETTRWLIVLTRGGGRRSLTPSGESAGAADRTRGLADVSSGGLDLPRRLAPDGARNGRWFGRRRHTPSDRRCAVGVAATGAVRQSGARPATSPRARHWRRSARARRASGRRSSAHPTRRAVDVLRRLSSSRTTRVVNSEDASAAGSSTVSDGRPGSDASFVRETASALAEPVALTAQSSHAVSRSRCSCRSIHQTAGWRPANATITRCTRRAMSSRRWTCAHSCTTI